jgi:hypothetical protein
MPSIVRVYPKPARERQRSLRSLKAAIYTVMADQIAEGMSLKVDARIGGLN